MKKLVILLSIIAMVGVLTTTAMADVELYGSARFRTYYADVDDGSGADSDKDLEWRMGHLSRFGANFKSDKITGQFELDVRAGDGMGGTQDIEAGSGASGLGDIRLRHLWGQWDFGAGKLLIGQTWPLYDMPVSGINYYSGGVQKLGGMGYDVARTSQFRLTFGDFKLALQQTDTTQTSPSATFDEVNVTLPKIELRYDMKLDAFALNFMGGWQTYEIENTTTKATKDINSWVLGFRGKANFGPAYAGLGLTYRQNGKNYGAWTVSTKETALFQGNDLKDATAWGVVASLGWKINEMFTLEGSYASLSSEQDTSLNNEDDTVTWGIIAKITMAPGVYIIPELIYQDNKDVSNNGVTTDQGDATIFGVFWKIDFK